MKPVLHLSLQKAMLLTQKLSEMITEKNLKTSYID